MVLNLEQLCALLQAELPVNGPSSSLLQITGVNTPRFAGETDLCFVETAEQRDTVLACRAGIVIVPEDFPSICDRVLIRLPAPREAFFHIAQKCLQSRFGLLQPLHLPRSFTFSGDDQISERYDFRFGY